MENLNIDFISVIIGYFLGVSLMYSIQTTMFLNEKHEDEEDSYENKNVYGWNYPYDNEII